MSSYEGTPQRATAISLADDGSRPNAGSINSGIVANRNYILWLDREMGRVFSRFSARNFVASDFSQIAEVAQPSPATPPDPNAYVTALCSNSEFFYVAVRLPSVAAGNTTYIAKTRDGIGWQIQRDISAPLANNLHHRALAVRSDGWVVAGMGSSVLGGAGQRIDVVNQLNTVNTNPRAGLSSATNYTAACFIADRCYCFGGTEYGAGLYNVDPGASARVVSASQAGSFLDWATPTGGALGGNLVAAQAWRVATKGTIAVAVTPGVSEVVRVDGVTNSITQPSVPGVGTITSNVVSWAGKFWIAKAEETGAATIFSSDDGSNWNYVSSLPVFAAVRMLVAEQQTLLAFEASEGGLFTGSHSSIDGVEWVRTALSTRLDALPLVASTESRSAFLRVQFKSYSSSPSNLRFSLGGLL